MKIVKKYLLIAGAPKCGTTSLFRYLSDHPDTCPSHRKETYFFAREFDLKKVGKSSETLEDFEAYFSHCQSDSKLRLEATPYTLYAKNAAKRIASLLQDTYVLFILREPIQRLISDFRFAIQREHPSAQHRSFQKFLKWQRNMRGDIPNMIEMGCYGRYIQDFIDVLGKNRVITVFFEDLISNQVGELQKICKVVGINDSFYLTYNFGIHNPTINYRSANLNRLYMRLENVVGNIRVPLMKYPKIHRLFERSTEFGKNIYRLMNNRKSSNWEELQSEMLEDIVSYYQPYNKMLSEALGCSLPWKTTEPVSSKV